MQKKLQKYITPLGVVSFITGFALMAYELVAARLLAPTIGSSIYVWTSVIGIIIAALSIGYWFGGKVADLRQKAIDIVILCLASALGVILTLFTYGTTLDWIVYSIEDVRLQGVVASLFLFAPTSFLLGCTSPYLAKLNIKTLKTAGESVASLSALNSIGGIIGTFVTGFILFSYIGSNETLIFIVLSLVFSSWLLVPKQRTGMRIASSIVLILLAFSPQYVSNAIARIDTPSANYVVSAMTYNNKPIIGLTTGPGGIQSAVYTDGSDELVFWYTQTMSELTKAQKPDSVLVLGGGAFTLPQELALSLPNTTIDAVEVDPALESISKEFFQYRDHPNVSLIFSDARAYVNTVTDKQYDVIIVDVFGDSLTPFSILTQEYGQRIQSLLAPDGIVLVNAIVGLEGKCRDLLNAIDATYRPFLPNAYWTNRDSTAVNRGNHVLLYSNKVPSTAPQLFPLVRSEKLPTYTDNFMPSEKLHHQCQESA
jgi:predicted membrane-bound spermidine synthase